MGKKPTNATWRFQRAVMGVLALISLVIGVFLYLEANPDRAFVCGIFVRVGLLLAAIWIAWPQIIGRNVKFSPLAIAMILAGLYLVAKHPKLFPIIAALMFSGFVVNAVMRRFIGKN